MISIAEDGQIRHKIKRKSLFESLIERNEARMLRPLWLEL